MRSRLPLAPADELIRAQEELLIVVPTFNESANLEELVRSVFEFAPHCHLLIVDDGSPDGTAALADELQHRFPGIVVLRRQGPRGLGRAYLAGFAYGLENGYERLGTMDADLSHDPRHLPAMLTQALSHEVVIGSRYIRDGGTINWRIRRILLSWLANAFVARLLGMPVHDATSGYRLYQSRVLRQVLQDELKSTGYSFLVELLYRLHRRGVSIAESPIVFYDRTLGESKLAGREIYVGALRLLRLRLTPPARGAADGESPGRP